MFNELYKINNYYNIMPIEKIEKSQESTDGNVYIIYTKNEKYVAKVYDNLQHTICMKNLYSFLISKNFNVPKIIENKYIKIENKYLILYSFLKGKSIKEIKDSNLMDKNVISNIAKELKKMHDESENYYDKNLQIVPFKTYNAIERKSILHFDLTKQNIFYNHQNVEFIDFDDAKYGPSIIDVSILISNLFISKKMGIELENIKLFIDEYYGKETKLKELEKAYIAEITNTWIDYILSNNVFDTSTRESFDIKKKLILNAF